MTPEDLQFYGEFAPALEANEKIMLTEVQRILDSISTDSETRLAEHIKSRIKSSGSLCEKLERQGLPVSAESGSVRGFGRPEREGHGYPGIRP